MNGQDKDHFDHRISAATGQGLEELERSIARIARSEAKGADGVVPTRARHVQLLNRSCRHLENAATAIDLDLELRAEELRLAERALGQIIGAVDAEDLLGEIFSEFCIGK
jgi:tRNA modification GTPase